jgi:hypothetical protein
MANPYQELKQEQKEKLLHSVKSRLALISSYNDDVLPVRFSLSLSLCLSTSVF